MHPYVASQLLAAWSQDRLAIERRARLMPSSRTPRRALPSLALSLAALMAGSLLVAASADAGTVRREGNTVFYKAAVREDNFVRVFQEAGETVVTDAAPSPAHLGALSGCRLTARNVAKCGFNVSVVQVETLDEADTVLGDSTISMGVDGGSGDDTFHAGRAPGASRTRWLGGPGHDLITFEGSSSPVTVRKNAAADDGRPSFGDADIVSLDVERVHGSSHGDVFEGSSAALEVWRGGPGSDRMSGLGGIDRFQEFGESTGSDTISGGLGGDDQVDYGVVTGGGRAQGVRVTLDNVADDGAPGERDDVRTDMEEIFLTPFADTFIGTSAAEFVSADEGNDSIDGRGGGDSISCFRGRDTAIIYPGDTRRDCESVGTFRLSPRRAVARPGAAVELSLAWSHPVDWKRLDEVQLGFSYRGKEVGRVTFDQETGRLRARGAVRLARRAALARVSSRGRRVSLRVAVKLSRRYAGKRLATTLGARADDGDTQQAQRAGTLLVRRASR